MTFTTARIRRTPTALGYAAALVISAAGLLVAFVSGRFEERLEQPAGVLLVGCAILWIHALRSAARSRDELRETLEHHQQVEDDLARSEERLRLAQKVARIGTWDMIDGDRNRSAWSDTLRELYDVPADFPASFENFLGLVHPDDRERIRSIVTPALETGGDFEFEYRLDRPDDDPRWLLSRGHMLLDEHGKPGRVLGVAIDISEQKAVEAEREALERRLRMTQKLEAVGRLAGGVAHDFNNLLLAIRGYGELARTALERGEDASEEVEEILTAANRATRVTKQLLAFSRKQVLRPEILDLNDVVTEMRSLLRPMIGEDVELETVLGEEEVLVDADSGQLEQVIANLAVNARDAMPDGGRLTLEVTSVAIDSQHALDLPPGRFAVLAVSDSGCGMDATTAAQIFEPFFTTKTDGTGLGLATVHGIVKQTGGSIWVYSEVGEGTTFEIYLPLAQQGAPVARPAVPIGPPRAASGETILLVEDDEQVRRMVARMLEARGYHLLTACNGAEALELADPANGAIDLLLTDLVMPGISGGELAARVSELQPAACILHMSGYTDDAVVRRGVLDRTAAFIEKPFSADDLARAIRDLLDRRDNGAEIPNPTRGRRPPARHVPHRSTNNRRSVLV